MTRTIRMAIAAAGVGTAVLGAWLLTEGVAARQKPAREPTFIAFRVDDRHVMATINVMGPMGRQVREGLSAEPVARFGYQHFEPPASWLDRVPAGIREATRWVVHAAPGQAFDADVERFVGGNAQCTEATAVLLRIDGSRAQTFASLRARYFVASPARRETPAVGSTSAVRVLPPPVFTAGQRRTFESALNALMARELPRIQAEARPLLSRAASGPVGYHRSWAHRQLELEEALRSRRAHLTYDIQSFQLAPDGVPLHFVRAEWTVRRRQGFAVSLWMRGTPPTEILQTNLRPASWLRMSEFQGKVYPDHLGLVLNVLDRDHDGWGEVLTSQSGYEGLSIQLFEYSSSGFQPAATEFACGC